MEVLMCVDTTRDNSFSLCHGGNAIPSSEVVRVGTHGRATDKTVIGLRHELLLGHVRQAGCAGVALLTRSTNRFKDTEKGPPVGWVKPGERGHANLLACLLPRLVDPLQVRGSPQRHSHSQSGNFVVRHGHSSELVAGSRPSTLDGRARRGHLCSHADREEYDQVS